MAVMVPQCARVCVCVRACSYEELSGILRFIFKGGVRKLISIDKFGTARWVKSGKKSSSIYDIDKVLLSLKYTLENCYFKFGNRIFRQVVGIPLGSDPAQLFCKSVFVSLRV